MGVLDEWVQLDEAVTISGRSKPTLYRWIKNGRVRSLKPWSVIWIHKGDLKEAGEDTRRGMPPKTE